MILIYIKELVHESACKYCIYLKPLTVTLFIHGCVCRIVVASSRQGREETDKARNSIPTSTSLICFSMTNIRITVERCSSLPLSVLSVTLNFGTPEICCAVRYLAIEVATVARQHLTI